MYEAVGRIHGGQPAGKYRGWLYPAGSRSARTGDIHPPDFRSFAATTSGLPAQRGLAESAGLGAGSEAQLAADLLAAVDDWVNAGSAMLSSEPQWLDSSLPHHCLEDLSQVIGRMHASTLLAADGDESLAAFRATIIKENLAILHTARAGAGRRCQA